MRIAVAMDSFKGSLTSMEAGNAVKAGILQADPSAQVWVCPLADGGEGTVQALYAALGGQWIYETVTGPLGEPISAGYCVLPDGTALLEMASAAGLPLVPPEQRNPLHTTTYGVGQLIRRAIEKGHRDFIIGIGGSATNDGGTGMLTALGFEFLDTHGNPISINGEGLKDLHRIDTAHIIPELSQCRFRIACDVTNPLCGENGCSAIFAPQKGATPETVAAMDRWMKNYARLAAGISPTADPDFPGAGAAGGLGFGFLAFTKAILEPGAQIILQKTHMEHYFSQADIVMTGEGRLDAQTTMGKGPIRVADLAKKYRKIVIAFCGCTGDGAEACNGHGIDAFFPILQTVSTPEEALNPETARTNLIRTAHQALRLIQAVGRK